MWESLIVSSLVGAVSAAVVDLQAYLAARLKDPTVKFEWRLMLLRLGIGFATGVLGGLAGKVRLETS